MSEIQPSSKGLELARDLMQASLGAVSDILRSGDYEFEWKPDNTPVSDIDKQVNKLVIDRISQVFPGDRVLGEEQSKEGDGNIWVIDPIDGTQALEQAIPAFTVCIARLDKNGLPQFSLVADPFSGDIYESVINQPTLKNGQPIHVSQSENIKYTYISSRTKEGFKTPGQIYDSLAEEGIKVFNLRSFVYSATRVAEGRAHAAIIGINPAYEAASVVPMILGAGGKVTDINGNEIERLDQPIDGLVVTNGIAHDRVLEILKS